jgi:hypothetical protein
VGKFNVKATPKAIMGKITNCEKKPTKKSFGVLNILVKSLTDRPRPSPSIINARQIGAILVTISIPFYPTPNVILIIKKLPFFLNLQLYVIL